MRHLRGKCHVNRLQIATSPFLLSVARFLGAKRMKERYRSTTNKTLAQSLVKWSLDPTVKNKIIESEELRDY